MNKAQSGMSSLKTTRTFLTEGTCSETLMNVLDRAFDNPMTTEEHAVGPLAGGIVQHGYQCGMLWGSTLAAGAQAFELFGASSLAETKAMIAAQKIVESFRARTKDNINCLEITETDWHNKGQIFKYMLRGGPIGCFHMAAKYAPEALVSINAALADTQTEAHSSPVSCSAMVARKMGASERQTVMAAGFAGGIGFTGGACGALGAAVWIIGLSDPNQKASTRFNDPRLAEIIDRFLKLTEYKFECSEIVGRKFASVADHADYLHAGGCAGIIEVLAGK